LATTQLVSPIFSPLAFQRGAVFVVGQRGTTVLNHHRFEIQHHGVASGGFAASASSLGDAAMIAFQLRPLKACHCPQPRHARGALAR
jgi:hypothetical protein